MSDRKPAVSATRLILQHRAVLHGYVYACVRNHADAEDIFQEVSLAIVESIDRLRDESGFLPWAREIAVRRVLAHARKSGRESPVDPHVIGVLAEASERVERERPAGERQLALRECLERLSPRHRQLIVLRYDDSIRTVEELAGHMGQTVQAVYAKIKRIKVALRECVERRLGGEAAG